MKSTRLYPFTEYNPQGAQLQESYTRIAVRHYARVTRLRALREWGRWVKLAAERRRRAMEQALQLDIRSVGTLGSSFI